jgi:Zn-dependent protease with chaperone function
VRNIKQVILTILILLPLMALAHGEDVLTTFFITIISIIIFIVVMSFIKLSFYKKLILSLVYFLSTVSIYYFTNDIPFNDNKNTINLSVALIPIMAVIITHFIIKRVKKP